LILIAAVVTAPIFLFGEGFEAKYVMRVAASNGLCIALCVGLLALLRKGHQRAAGGMLVYGLLALVGALAWANGEHVHVNVINFTLVTVLASAICERRQILMVGALSSIEMIAIAWDRPLHATGEIAPLAEDLAEARFESIVQFLPTYLVVVAVLWLRESRRAAGS
jgi:hypothetical protein